MAPWIFQQRWGDCSSGALRYDKQGIRGVASSKEGIIPVATISLSAFQQKFEFSHVYPWEVRKFVEVLDTSKSTSGDIPTGILFPLLSGFRLDIANSMPYYVLPKLGKGPLV